MAIQQFPQPTPDTGIPSGNTAGRPAAPVVGTTYYNGELAQLEIYTGTEWVPSSAVPGSPTISVADVGTSVAYGSAQGVVTITPPSNGGLPSNYLISSSTGGYTATTSGTTVNIIVGDNGSYTFSGAAFNDFGNGVSSPTSTATLTTVPQAPTIGTATASPSTSGVIAVTWTLGNNGGKNLTQISVTPYLNGTTAQTAQVAATTSATSLNLTGLTQGSSFTFKVKATNANGDSAESAATNSATSPTIVEVNFLVAAGGGGGGGGNSTFGGGGGAGGYRTSAGTSGRNTSAESALFISPATNYTVTVGAGGAGGASRTQGSDSVLSNITSSGGGGGGGANNAATNGGSGGGGGSGTNNNYFEGTNNSNTQGFPGGRGPSNANSYGSGGGGGAGSVGQSYPGGGLAGNGGNGIASNITGSSVTRGGGGGGGGSGSWGAGGTGGGGNGEDNGAVSGNAGDVNTGGGGGGGDGTAGSGKAGGSGIVIIKYADTLTATVGAGLTSSENSSGGFKIRTFTAGTGNVSIA